MRTAVSRLCRNQDDRAYILTEPLRRLPDGEGGGTGKEDCPVGLIDVAGASA